MTCNFVTKEATQLRYCIRGICGRAISVSSTQQSLARLKFKDDSEMETVVTRWLITQDRD